MLSHVLEYQKKLLTHELENNPSYILRLVLLEELKSIMEMDLIDIQKASFLMDSPIIRQQFFNQRASFWKKEFDSNSEKMFQIVFALLKERAKTIHPSFDFINKFVIEEIIH